MLSRTVAWIGGISALAGCAKAPVARATQFPSSASEVTVVASDGGKVFAELIPSSASKGKAVVLMFHQAGSGASEYAPIAPRVAKLGFDCLAVDLRSGGDMYQPANRTAAEYPDKPDYAAAFKDMEGALGWATRQSGYKKIVLWGSSYSASLVLRLASEHPDIAAVLSFSPGEYFNQDGLVKGWNAKVKCPVLMACTDRELGDVTKIFGGASGTSRDYVLIHTKDGIHGSSTLREDANPLGNGFYWKGVEAFLGNVLK